MIQNAEIVGVWFSLELWYNIVKMLLFEAKVLKSTAIIHKYSKFPIEKQSQNTSYRVKLEHKLLGNFQEILVQDIKLVTLLSSGTWVLRPHLGYLQKLLHLTRLPALRQFFAFEEVGESGSGRWRRWTGELRSDHQCLLLLQPRLRLQGAACCYYTTPPGCGGGSFALDGQNPDSSS